MAINAAHRHFPGENVFIPAVGADHQPAFCIDAGGGAAAGAPGQFKGHPAAQVDAGRGVFLPVVLKALWAEGVQLPVNS